ncbi:hypothetical protein MRX96_021532 [Rhipicephalus microplus]
MLEPRLFSLEKMVLLEQTLPPVVVSGTVNTEKTHFYGLLSFQRPESCPKFGQGALNATMKSAGMGSLHNQRGQLGFCGQQNGMPDVRTGVKQVEPASDMKESI